MESKVLVVAGVEYPIIKKGRAQAEQVKSLAQWLSKYGYPIVQKFQADSGEIESRSWLELLSAALDSLSADALISLFTVVVGCPQEVSEEEFEIGILIEGLTILFKEQPSLKKMVDRFFSAPNSPEEEPQEQSTPSE